MPTYDFSTQKELFKEIPQLTSDDIVRIHEN